MTAAAEVLRPFLWLAALAFLVGFVSYLALGRPMSAESMPWEAGASTARVSAPVSDDWNTPKHI